MPAGPAAGTTRNDLRSSPRKCAARPGLGWSGGVRRRGRGAGGGSGALVAHAVADAGPGRDHGRVAQLAAQPADRHRHGVGKRIGLLVPDLLTAREMRRFGDELQHDRAALFREHYRADVRPFPGVREAFETLRSRGIRLALGSSSDGDDVEYYTELLGVGDLIEASTS